MADWTWAMNTMMPPYRGENTRITNTYQQHLNRSADRKRRKDGGVDISYPSPKGGAPIYSPIAGTVTLVAGSQYNTTTVTDSSGNRHRFLHMSAITVKHGTQIKAGTQIGFEGGRGPKGNDSYVYHLHYDITLKNSGSAMVDPVLWWNGDRDPGATDNSEPTQTPNEFAEKENISSGGEPIPSGSAPPPPVGNASEYAPRPAEKSKASNISLAVWTNRMPNHEPWARVLLTDTTTNEPTETVEYNVNHEPQIADDGTEETSGKIGKLEGMVTYPRNKFWRR